MMYLKNWMKNGSATCFNMFVLKIRDRFLLQIQMKKGFRNI